MGLNECSCVSNKTSLMDVEIWVLYHFYGPQNVILVLIFPQPFKIVKAILSLQAVQKQVGDGAGTDRSACGPWAVVC